MEGPTLKSIIYNDAELKAIAAELLNKYKENLRTFDAVATGKLLNTASQSIEYEGDTITLYFDLESYWYYLENGPRPHFPPVSVIENWIRIKNIKPAPRGRKKAPTVKQLAFAICKTMQKGKRDIDGQQKAYISRPALRYMLTDNEQLVQRFITRITEIIEEQSSLQIDSILEFTNNSQK